MNNTIRRAVDKTATTPNGKLSVYNRFDRWWKNNTLVVVVVLILLIAGTLATVLTNIHKVAESYFPSLFHTDHSAPSSEEVSAPKGATGNDSGTPSTTQNSTGDQSPNLNGTNGDVQLNYGDDKKGGKQK